MSYPVPPNRNPSKYWEMVQAHLNSLQLGNYIGQNKPIGNPKPLTIKPPEEGSGNPQKP